MLTLSYIEYLRIIEMSVKLYNHQIGLTDGEMIALRSIYNQLDQSSKQFILDKYSESVKFLEEYEGIRKRKRNI